MTKRALLIGCNYTATPAVKLTGCINDVVHMRNTLIDAYGYQAANIYLLRDDVNNMLPTRANILSYLTQLVATSVAADTLWIHYSGHGTQVRDTNKDETDGFDECIVPCNYNTAGVITDDDLFNIFKNAKCQLIIFFDSCYSGTGCDLQYVINYNNGALAKTVNNSKMIANTNIVMISGCQDSQTSADAYDSFQQQGVGAFTQILLETLRSYDHNVALLPLYSSLCANLKSSRFSQMPVLSSSIPSPSYQFSRVNANGAPLVASSSAVTGDIQSNTTKIIFTGNYVSKSPVTKSLRGLMSSLIV